MSSVSPIALTGAPGAPTRHRIAVVTLWLGAVVVAGFLAMLLRDSAFVDGAYIPRTTDSLYHANRIVDAAVGERGFYQFDERLHVPDGTWIPWPWGYDYLMAKATQLALWIKPGLEPMAFLTYVAPVWIAVNAALVLAATGVLNLSMGMRCLAMLGFALSPFTQILHAAGQIDHHFVELTFVLLNIWLGLSWFEQPHLLKWPISLGVALGVSQAFHNGLFVLQLMPLVCVFILWLRQEAPPEKSLLVFCIGLLSSTQLILLPSEPYRHGMFEFGLLSWFHFYAALSTSAAVAFMAWKPASARSVVALAVIALALSAPMLTQVLRGASFLTAEFSILSTVAEAQSPYTMATETWGLRVTVGFYSWLLLLAPLFLLVFLFQVTTQRQPVRLFYTITSAFGLILMLTQYRFHYFGIFALLTAGLVIIDQARERHGWHSGVVFTAALAAMVIAYQPALKTQLFEVHVPGSDPEYAIAWPLYTDLAQQCAIDPGVVLANSDDGNAILYHTECSVIANNFILRPEDDVKLREVYALMSGTLQAIREKKPDIKYILVRSAEFTNGDGFLNQRLPVAQELLTLGSPPKGFRRIQTVFSEEKEGAPQSVYARLYKVVEE